MADRTRSDALKDLGRLLLGHAGRFRDHRLQEIATTVLREDRRWVMRAVNASVLARQRLDHALRLEPRRAWSRLAFPWRHPASTGEPPRSLSLLCPTRSRCAWVRDFLDSVRRTAVAPGRIEALFYVDDDDPDLEEYRELFERARWTFGEVGRCELVVGEPVGVPAAWNRLAEQSTGDLLMMANDDQLYVEHGWDTALDRRVGELTRLHPDGVLCLYFDAGQYPEGGCDFPILSRTWYETVGYFTPTIFQQWEVERWLFDIAQRLGRLHPVPGVLVEHRHYQDYKAPFDATYQRHRMTREKSFADHALFLRTQKLRDAEVGKLRAVIEAGGTVPRSPDLPAEAGPAVRRHYASLIDELHAAGLAQRARACAELAVRQGVWTHPLHRPVDHLPGLPLRTEYDPGDFWFSSYLADHHAKLVTELPGAGVRLFEAGQWTSEAMRSFPVTVSVLSTIPEATLMPGATVDIDVLAPRTAVTARCGHSNAALRVEYCLRVGEGSGLRVGDRRTSWTEGGCLVFDDGMEREYWNEGTAPRAVLSFTVPHPDLPQRAV